MPDVRCSNGWVLEKYVDGENIGYKPFFINVRGEDIIGPYGEVGVPNVNYSDMDFIKNEAKRLSGDNRIAAYLDNYKYTFITPDKNSKVTMDSNLNFDLVTKYDVYANKARVTNIPNTVANGANVYTLRVPVILPFKVKNTDLFINEIYVNTDAVFNIFNIYYEYNKSQSVQFLNELSVYLRVSYTGGNATVDKLLEGQIRGSFMELNLNMTGKLYR